MGLVGTGVRAYTGGYRFKARGYVDGEGEGISRGDVPGHGGSGDIGGRVGVGVGERGCKEAVAERKDLGRP